MRLPKPFLQTSEKGSALMACVILSFVLMASILWFANWSWNRSRADVPGLTAQRAMQYADSCVNSTNPWLKDPRLKQLLPPGTSNSFTLSMPNGHCDVSLYRRSTNNDFVDTYATGYYYVATGRSLDPSGQRSMTASINAKFMVSNVAEYLTAVPGTLEIAYGANASNGILYGGNLLFDYGTANPQTIVSNAEYFNTSGVFPAGSPAVTTFVNFSGSGGPKQLAYPPNFSQLDASIRSEYYNAALGNSVPDFEGTVSAPASHVYYVNGDVEIGTNQPLVVQGVYVIYSTGTVTINNNITLADTDSWIGVLAENDIRIAATAPQTLTIYGNYVMNGVFTAYDVPLVAGSQFNIFGGIVSLSGIQVFSPSTAKGFSSRVYTYKNSTDPNLMLPSITNVLQYTVTSGASASR